MGVFKKQNAVDRRSHENLYMSLLVDVGTTYRRTLGVEPARTFLREQAVPACLVKRILAQDARCRAPGPELPGSAIAAQAATR
ncbi:MAG TPA: hypothetical protein VF800_22805 [Telluria sp.]